MNQSKAWQQLGYPEPEDLGDARLQLHWAAQTLASFGEAYVPHRSDYRHRAMVWDGQFQALVSWGRSESGDLRLVLHMPELRLALCRDGAQVSDLVLAGRRLADAYDWIGGVMAQEAPGAPELVRLSTEKIPDHGLGRGEAFDAGHADARAEVCRWFENLAGVLEEVRDANPGAAPVLCWPHHFDLATLVVLDADADPEEARSIGVGMVPGDDWYPDPYLYVAPWPHPDTPTLHDLPEGGRWHTDSWLGGVMDARYLVDAGSAQAQRAAAMCFFEGSVSASRLLLGAD